MLGLKQREIAAIIAVLILEYLLYPYYEKGISFLGAKPFFWLLIPVLVGVLVYFLWSTQKLSDKIRELLNKEEQQQELVDPIKRFEEFENNPARALLPKNIKLKYWIPVKNKWVYVIDDGLSTKYVILNGLPGSKLNPTVIDKLALKDIGYENIKDYKRSEKARTLYDLLTIQPDLDISKLGDIE